MNLLRPVAARWYVLCIQLGVSHGDLDNIAANPLKLAGAPLTFLQDGLYVWLQQDPPSKRTISALCDVLRSPVMDENRLCREVAESLNRRSKGIAKILVIIIIIIIIMFIQDYHHRTKTHLVSVFNSGIIHYIIT